MKINWKNKKLVIVDAETALFDSKKVSIALYKRILKIVWKDPSRLLDLFIVPFMMSEIEKIRYQHDSVNNLRYEFLSRIAIRFKVQYERVERIFNEWLIDLRSEIVIQQMDPNFQAFVDSCDKFEINIAILADFPLVFTDSNLKSGLPLKIISAFDNNVNRFVPNSAAIHHILALYDKSPSETILLTKNDQRAGVAADNMNIKVALCDGKDFYNIAKRAVLHDRW